MFRLFNMMHRHIMDDKKNCSIACALSGIFFPLFLQTTTLIKIADLLYKFPPIDITAMALVKIGKMTFVAASNHLLVSLNIKGTNNSC